MKADELKEILKKHKMWINDEDGGERANLYGANLYKADLRGANLCDANLCDADLRGADLRGANLRIVNLYGANLCDADLRGAEDFPYIPYSCPDFGSFIGYKKANGYIVELEILADARRCSATTQKCRCDKAKVLSIQNANGTIADIKQVSSDYN